MRVHTTYKIYPKAINDFINDNYNLHTINFGNVKNNLIAILQKLNIDSVLKCNWDVSPLYFFDRLGISKSQNKPTDFHDYSNFKFRFNAQDGISNEEFEEAISIFESDFINKYQKRLDIERQELKRTLKLEKKREDILIYTLSAIAFIILTSIALYIKSKS